MVEPLDFLRDHDAAAFRDFVERHDFDEADLHLLRRLVANAGFDAGRIRDLFPYLYQA